MLTTITILRRYGMACGCVDVCMGWMGGWVDGDDGLSPLVPVRSTVALPLPTLRGADTRAGLQTFSFAAAEAGRAKTRAAGYRLLQHCMNNRMRGGEQRGERDEGLKTETRTIDTKPFWTLAILVRSNCDAGGGF
jgi:hypothetical protein